ncbi:hypothetical protein KPC83_03200 [Collinsella sp. zg1085]|uniref:hypothetical protein n=1 Tax=Collinsella sp. zg1085 TaxID=2844380 RepID=UPI001C0B7E31|nr:hypothetical protein [Collinsella sp. zg1085]QWT18149.1 hypothetical protein KPC83_03200 [Collinsella sp. zg1085]
MDLAVQASDIAYAESFLAAGDLDGALPVLESLTHEVQTWAEETCADTSERQWFAFDDAFERLAYRRVEKDPRHLEQLEVPLARLYSDLAFVYIQVQDFAQAREALMQAVRWNPMNCSYRLDLAELNRVLGEKQEWAALSNSVLERATDTLSRGRAYANLGAFFLGEGGFGPAEACARLAERSAAGDSRVVRLRHNVMTSAPSEIIEAEDGQLMAQLSLEGIETAPSTEIAICLLMCATDAAQEGDTARATDYTIRARDLVGEEAAKALISLIHESDAELAQEEQSGSPLSSAQPVEE